MNLLILVLIPLMAFTQDTTATTLFSIDVRTRFIPEEKLYVVVQVDNHTGRSITGLEGFLTEVNPQNKIISENPVTLIHMYDPIFRDGQSTSRAFTYAFSPDFGYKYYFHISHITFKADSRVFLYSPSDGLMRIE